MLLLTHYILRCILVTHALYLYMWTHYSTHYIRLCTRYSRATPLCVPPTRPAVLRTLIFESFFRLIQCFAQMLLHSCRFHTFTYDVYNGSFFVCTTSSCCSRSVFFSVQLPNDRNPSFLFTRAAFVSITPTSSHVTSLDPWHELVSNDFSLLQRLVFHEFSNSWAKHGDVVFVTHSTFFWNVPLFLRFPPTLVMFENVLHAPSRRIHTFVSLCRPLLLCQMSVLTHRRSQGAFPPQFFSISSHFLLWEAVSQRKYRCSPKVKHSSPQKNFGLATSLCWLTFFAATTTEKVKEKAGVGNFPAIPSGNCFLLIYFWRLAVLAAKLQVLSVEGRSRCTNTFLNKAVAEREHQPLGQGRGGARGATAPPKYCLDPPKAPKNFPRDVRRSRSLSESPTQTIDSSPCCKTGPSSAPPNENVWLHPWDRVAQPSHYCRPHYVDFH